MTAHTVSYSNWVVYESCLLTLGIYLCMILSTGYVHISMLHTFNRQFAVFAEFALFAVFALFEVFALFAAFAVFALFAVFAGLQCLHCLRSL